MPTLKTHLKTALSLAFTGVFLHAAAQAQTWRQTAVQKAKAAETISAIKYNVARSSSPEQTARELKRARQENLRRRTAQFTHLTEDAYKYPKDRARILERRAKLQKELNQIPAFADYALTVQHPADLYNAPEPVLDLASRALASFNAASEDETVTPASALLFPTGAVVVRFDAPGGKQLHFAFKPLEAEVKVAVGDFPLSEREFGSNPQTLKN